MNNKTVSAEKFFRVVICDFSRVQEIKDCLQFSFECPRRRTSALKCEQPFCARILLGRPNEVSTPT